MRSRVAAVALALIIASFHTVNATPWRGPEPTPANLKNERGWTPKPTSRPVARNLKRSQITAEELFGLNRRQNLDICGYEDALADDPIYCPLGYQCANDIQNYAAGCCTTTAALSNCYLPTECQPYDPSTSSFTPQFTSDLYTTFCGNFEPFCFVRSYLVSSAQTTYYEVGCTTLSLPDETVYDTYSGETTSGGTSSPSVVTISVTAPNPNNNGALAGSSSGVPGSGGSSGGGGGGGGGGTNIGAIVGGVVGGLGGLALLVGIILFCCLRKRKKERKQKTTANIHNNQQTAGQSPQPQQLHYQPPPSMGPQSLPPMSQASAAPYNMSGTNTTYTSGAGYPPYATAQPQPGYSNVPNGGFGQPQYQQPQYQPQMAQQQSQTLSPYTVSSPGGASQTAVTSSNLTSAHPDSAGVSRLGSPGPVDGGAQTTLGIGTAVLGAAGAAGALHGAGYGGIQDSRESQEHPRSLNHETEGVVPGASRSQQSGANGSPNPKPTSDALHGGIATQVPSTGVIPSQGGKNLEQSHERDGTVYHELGG